MLATLDRSKIPVPKSIGKITVQRAVKTFLGNGIEVYSVNAGFQDLVKIEWIFRNPSFDVSQPLAGSASNRMLNEGSSKHTSQELAEMIDAYGAFYETEESSDYSSVVLFTLNKYLDQTLPVMFETMTDPVFPANELSTFIQNNRQRLMVESEKVNSVARKKFNEVIFGSSHSYGYNVKPGDYEKLERESLRKFHRENYKSKNCSILVAGKVNDGTLTLLNKYFGLADWGGSIEKMNPEVAPIESDTQKKHLVDKEGAVQSAIRIGKVMFNKTHPDYIGMTILNTALGGYFGSRLMSNIREDKGYTYGIGSAMVSMKQGGCFFISTEVGSEVTTKALEEIYREVEKLKTDPPSGNELQMVKNFMTGSFLKGIDGAFQLAERWKGLWIHDLDYDYFDRYLDKIKTIQADELTNLARKHLNFDDFYEVVVGKK